MRQPVANFISEQAEGSTINLAELEFKPANMVERQLIAAANGDAQQQKAFEKFILDETLYVATPEVRPAGAVTLRDGTVIQLLNVTLNDGRHAAAVFTSPDRIEMVFGEVGYFGLQGRALFEMIRAQPAMLNPGYSYCAVWEPESIAAMLGLSVERIVKKDTQIILANSADTPVELVDRLTAVFSAVSQVDSAWLALATWPDTKDQSWYFDVRADTEDRDLIRRALSQALEGIDLQGRSLDMFINPVGDAAGSGIRIVENRQSDSPKMGLLKRLFS